MSPARVSAIKILAQVIRQKQSLSEVFPEHLVLLEDKEQPLCKQLCFGVMRHYFQIQAITKPLLKKPPKAKDTDILMSLYCGIYQLLWLKTPDHAAINEMVSLTRNLKKQWASKLVNAILRQVQRQSDSLDLASLPTHPEWLVKAIKKDWPEEWKNILQQNQLHPPMTLRINTGTISQYIETLNQEDIYATALEHCPSAVVLDKPQPVNKLPGFEQGTVYVQDAAAQQVVRIMGLSPELTVLDACAAPGGKTSHILIIEPSIQLTALDNKARRLEKIEHNLSRQNLEASLIVGDARSQDWWDGELFDRVLCDVPCSATGIIRRHPDIKVLRTFDEIETLLATQQEIINNCWAMLKPGGLLIYTTCSILKRENDDQIKYFLASNKDAQINNINNLPGKLSPYGLQSLPGENSQDGFYYAQLQKK